VMEAELAVCDGRVAVIMDLCSPNSTLRYNMVDGAVSGRQLSCK
jgi:hypothetical protein